MMDFLRKSKWNHRTITIVAFLVLTLLAVFCVVYLLAYARTCREASRNIDISECTPYGYTQINNYFINTVENGDANLQLPSLNQDVNWVSVKFSSPIKQQLNVSLYYLIEADGIYDENHTVSVSLREGSDCALLYVGKEITTCRIDIGSKMGEEFELEHITINDEQLATFQKSFRVLLLYLLAVCVTVMLLILFVYKLNTAKTFAILALLLGCLYCVTITPLSVPDEPHHYQSAYWLSNILLFKDDSEYGDPSDFNYTDFVGHQNVSSGYIRILKELGRNTIDSDTTENDVIPIPMPRDLAYFIEYLPQAAGITLARIMNLNFVQMFLLGRLFNLLFYTALLYYAIKRTPIFKTMFGLIGIMPMSLHQAASFSYDAFVNGMSLLLIASILKEIYAVGPLKKKDYFYILIVGALLAPAKVVYFPIMLLSVLIPKQRFGNKKKKMIGLAIMWTAGLLLILVFNFSSHFLLSSNKEGSHTLNYEGYHNYELSFVFKYPMRTIKIFTDTFNESAWGWIKGAIGQTLSGLTLTLPGWIVDGYMAAILLSAQNQVESTYILKPHVRSSLYLVSLVVVFLIMFSFFLGWTSNFRTRITGVQGRYFIPIIPLLALSTNNQVLVLKKNIDRMLIVFAVLLQCSAIFYIMNYTLLH